MQSELLDRTAYFFTEIYSKLIIKLLVAIIIIFIGFILGKVVGRLILKLLSEISINSFFKKATGINTRVDLIISKGITYIIDFFVIIIALDAIAFTPTLIYILSGALLITIMLSIIVGIKDFIPNIIAGIFLYRRNVIRHGDKIEISGHRGKVEKITLMETIIKKTNGDFLYIPNSAVTKNLMVKKR